MAPAALGAAFSRKKASGGDPREMNEGLPLARTPRSRRGFRLTPRDKEIVRWIGRLRMAGAAQVAGRFDLGRAVTYARLRGLVRLGLLEHARIFHGAPGVYLATRVGLASVDLDLPPARVDLRTYGHDLELTSLVLELEREFGPDRVRTEREMRASDTSPGRPAGQRPSFAVSLTGARGQLQLTPAGYPACTSRLCGDRREGRGRPIARGRARAHGQGASATAPHPRRLRRGQTHRLDPLLRARRPRPESS
jgi:hypothetical protein